MSTPIFLKPLLEDGDCFKQQTKDIKNYFQPAFRMVNLKLPDQEQDGYSVSGKEVTPLLVERIFNANIVIVDANPYPDDIRSFPWLFYCIGLSHSLQNHTILIGRSLDHLPASFRRQHALSYDVEQPAEFFDQFVPIFKSILGGENQEADNPIQEYLRRRKLEDELQKFKLEAQTKDAQLKELQQHTKQEPKSPSTITFRKVG